MQINKNIRIKPFKFKNNYNLDYSPYYVIENGVYRFLDKMTRLKFEYSFGITCTTRRQINPKTKKLDYYFYDEPITQRQKEFMKKRAVMMNNNRIPSGTTYIHSDCGCKKKWKLNDERET